MHTRRTKYSCIRRSGLSSGWKLVASFLPFLTATIRSASSSAGPKWLSDGGASAAKSGGKEHSDLKADSLESALPDCAKEWRAGALMKMAGNGTDGLLSSGISSCASKLANWSAENQLPRLLFCRRALTSIQVTPDIHPRDRTEALLGFLTSCDSIDVRHEDHSSARSIHRFPRVLAKLCQLFEETRVP